MNNTSVDSFLVDGCGRCENYKTPECKVRSWTAELAALRAILLETELTEEMKWGAPCYTLDGKNVVNLSALEDRCVLGFFKGVALTGDEGLLVKPGPNTRLARSLEFTSLEQIDQRRQVIEHLLKQAIELEKSGREVLPQGDPEPMPAELEQRLAADPELSRAYDALTPGRRRSYILHVSGAKQAATRQRRVERCVPKILAGKGFSER